MITTFFFFTFCFGGFSNGDVVTNGPLQGNCGAAENGECGRRRLSEDYDEFEVSAASDAELCLKVHEYLETTFFKSLLKEYVEKNKGCLIPGLCEDTGSAQKDKVAMAGKIETWCKERAGDVSERRRSDEGDWNAYAKSVTVDLAETGLDVHGNLEDSEAYLNSMRRIAESDEFMARRRESVDLLPEGQYKQCAAYSYFTAQLLENLAHNGAADMILYPDEFTGCGAIVNSVNDALKTDHIPGVQVVDIEGMQVVVTNNPELAKRLNLHELHSIYYHKVEWFTEESTSSSAVDLPKPTNLALPDTPLRRLAKLTAAGSTFVLMTLCQSYQALAAGTAAATAYQAIAL